MSLPPEMQVAAVRKALEERLSAAATKFRDRASEVTETLLPSIRSIAYAIAFALMPYFMYFASEIEGRKKEFDESKNFDIEVPKWMLAEHEGAKNQLVRDLIDVQKAHDSIEVSAALRAGGDASVGLTHASSNATKKNPNDLRLNARSDLKRFLVGYFGNENALIPPEASVDTADSRNRRFVHIVALLIVVFVVAAIEWLVSFHTWMFASSKPIALGLSAVSGIGLQILAALMVRSLKRYLTYLDALSAFRLNYPEAQGANRDGFSVFPLSNSDRVLGIASPALLLLASASLVWGRVATGLNFGTIASTAALLFTLLIFGIVEFVWFAPALKGSEYAQLRECTKASSVEVSQPKFENEDQILDRSLSLLGRFSAESAVSIRGLLASMAWPWANYFTAVLAIFAEAERRLTSAENARYQLIALREEYHSGCLRAIEACADGCTELARAVARSRDPFSREEGPRLLVCKNDDTNVYLDQDDEVRKILRATLKWALFEARGVVDPPPPPGATLNDALVYFDPTELADLRSHRMRVELPSLRVNRYEILDRVYRATNTPRVGTPTAEEAKEPDVPLTLKQHRINQESEVLKRKVAATN